MPQIENLSAKTLDHVVARVVTHQRELHERHALIASDVDGVALGEQLYEQREHVAVASTNDHVTGHLRGTILGHDDASVWIGPDSVSYDDARTLESLYQVQAERWVARGATRHYVWVARDEIEPWLTLGFALAHQRGVLSLATHEASSMIEGYTIRRGALGDLDTAVHLDHILDDAQRASPSFLSPTGDARTQWRESLEDPDAHHFIVERDGVAVAQCLYFGLDQRVGSFERTAHLSAVSVQREHRRLGVARAMVDHALAHAANEGFTHVETNWRVTNRRAARYWESYGFCATYTRLFRVIGSD